MAQEGVRGYRVTGRAVDDVALDSPEVGHRTEGLPGAGRDGSRGLEERGNAVAFVPAARRRDSAAGGVAPDAADCEPLTREDSQQNSQHGVQVKKKPHNGTRCRADSLTNRDGGI